MARILPDAGQGVWRNAGGERNAHRCLGPLPLTWGEGRARTSDQGVMVTMVLEALQLFASSVSTTVFPLSAQASRK